MINHNNINRQCAKAMGLCWHEYPIEHPITLRVYCEKCNMLLISGDSGVMVEVNTNPDFCNDWNAMRLLVDYAIVEKVDFSLSMDAGKKSIASFDWASSSAGTAPLAVALAFRKCFGEV